MHEGVNIGEVEYVVVKDFGIEDKLSYFMGDNASNNDMTICSVESRIGFDPKVLDSIRRKEG